MAIDQQNSIGNSKTARIKAKAAFLICIGFINGFNYDKYNEEDPDNQAPLFLIVGYFMIAVTSSMCLLCVVVFNFGQDHLSMAVQLKRCLGFALIIGTGNAITSLEVPIWIVRNISYPSFFSALFFVPAAVLLAIDVQRL